jgi:hypothetical protein
VKNRFSGTLEAVHRSAQNRRKIASFFMGQMYEYKFWKQFAKIKMERFGIFHSI